MDPLFTILFVTLLAGLAMAAGALVASLENFQSDWLRQEFRHSVMAFGGGALLSSVALILVPEGIGYFNPLSASALVLFGGLVFMGIDIQLQKHDTSASQLVAMLLDFIPESIALGGAFVTGNINAFLLAGIIALQNLPEGFNAFRELRETTDYSDTRLVLAFTPMSLFGPLAALLGYLWLGDSPAAVGGIMLFASGGILYSIFQDIAPQVKLDRHWGPPMGAVLGFVAGMVGVMITGHT